MQLVLLLVQVKEHAAAHAFRAPSCPLVQQLAYAEHARHTADQHIEIAGKAVHQRRHLHQLRHQLVRIRASLEVDRNLEAGKVGLVSHVCDLAHLAGLNQLGDLVDDRFDRGRVRDLGDLDQVFLFVIRPFGAHLERAAAGLVDRAHLGLIVDQLAAGRKVRRWHGRNQIMLRVFDIFDRRAAHLAEVEAAEIGCHADRNARVRGHEDVREGGRQQHRLLHRAVVVVHEIDRVRVDVAEQLGAERVQLGFGVTRRGVRHVARIHLAEVALGVHERSQQRLVAARQAHHSLVNGRIAVRVELHGRADNVRGLGAVAVQQPHLVHGVQQLAVRRLKAVDLRDRARHNNAHRIRHIVLAQRVRDALINRGMLLILFYLRFFRHSGPPLSLFFCAARRPTAGQTAVWTVQGRSAGRR